jgi:ribosome biogenesis GTPase
MVKRAPRHYGKKTGAVLRKEDSSDFSSGQNGLVVSNYGQTLDIEDESGQVHRCTARKKIDTMVCGDRVLWLSSGGDTGVVVALQPRQTLLVRPDSRGALKPIAANVDRLFVVTTVLAANAADGAVDQELLDTALIDRYLVAAELSRIQAIIVINKTDLLSPDALSRAKLLMEVYQDIGYRVLFTSAKQQHGADELIAALKEHISVFCGPSGVGKSSLVKAVLPDQEIRVGEISAATGGGRHTTTLATLYHLPHGGGLIDSPGVRDFGLWHVGAAQVAQGFVEFKRFAGDCRFADCSHLAEPGCAVQQAAQKELISAIRLASYRRIVASLHH